MTQPVSAAPSYEPELWNDTSTLAQRASFLEDQHENILRITAKRDSGHVLNEDNRFKYQSLVESQKQWLTKSAISTFQEIDVKAGGDNQKLAAYFGMKPEDIPATRAAMQKMGQLFGYEDYANCYTYAMNANYGLASSRKEIGGADPGTFGGTDPQSDVVNNEKNQASNAGDYEAYKKAVMKGVLADGAKEAGMDGKPVDGFYRVAVLTKPHDPNQSGDVSYFDMHFARENKEGGWSHKAGSRPVTDKDMDGKPITDPKTANFGGYDFLGYVYVPEGGLDVGRRGEQPTKPGSIAMFLERELNQKISAHGAFPDIEKIAENMKTSSSKAEPAQEEPKQPAVSKVIPKTVEFMP